MIARFLRARIEDIEPILDRACARSGGRYTTAWLLTQAASLNPAVELWMVTDAQSLRGIAATCIVDYPSGLREAQLCAAASDGGAPIPVRQMRDWLYRQIIPWAMRRGASVLYFEGRSGFLRTSPLWRRLGITAELRMM